MKRKAYASAGVDVDLGNQLKSGIQKAVQATHGPEVLGRIGSFGGLFRPNFKGMKDPVLVSSVDGVGTKLKVAFAAKRYRGVAEDLVNHCVNDIAVLGAKPLFFLDYIAAEKVEPPVFRELIAGFSKACQAAGCALIGGETAQMPGMYQPGEFDLAGCIVGVVDRPKMIDGSKIAPGDVILGLKSNGLHTNGYSLARRVLFDQMGLQVSSLLPGSKATVASELLRVHRCYLPELQSLPQGMIKGMAHITGGGLIDNLPRVLPPGCDAVINAGSWKIPPVFRLLQEEGGIDPLEMFQVFNMGVGMAMVVSPRHAVMARATAKAFEIGRVVPGTGITRIEL